MCLLIFAHQPGTQLPLVVAANRDEFHARPTAPSAFWHDRPEVFAGRDLQAGGTWMGINRSGRFAAITNYRDPDRTVAAPRSRGELPLDFLCDDRPVQQFLDDLNARAHEYAGFNLLLSAGEEMWHLSNATQDIEPVQLSPGIYGLSNASLDTPWPKVQKGKAVLTDLLQAGEGNTHSSLAKAVGGRTLANPAELHAQGLAGEMDELLSAQFIVTPGYGTRSRTTLWRESEGTAHWREQSFNEEGELTGEQRVVVPGNSVTPPDCE